MDRWMKRAVASIVISSFLVGSASATTNIVYPITGAGFKPQGASTGNAAILYVNGLIFNTSATSQLFVEAPLGHVTAGTYKFDIIYLSNGGTVTCSVFARPDLLNSDEAGFSYVYSSAATAPSGFTGAFITVTATPPSAAGAYGTYMLSMVCALPKAVGNNATAIQGVKPLQ